MCFVFIHFAWNSLGSLNLRMCFFKQFWKLSLLASLKVFPFSLVSFWTLIGNIQTSSLFVSPDSSSPLSCILGDVCSELPSCSIILPLALLTPWLDPPTELLILFILLISSGLFSGLLGKFYNVSVLAPIFKCIFYLLK